MNNISLIVGDWSGDGHEKYNTYVYQSNLNHLELEEAFKKGSEILGFNLTEYCENYEDNRIPKKVGDKLTEMGIEFDDCDSDTYLVYFDSYVKSYMLIAKTGFPELEYKLIPENKSKIHIGGYGLFY